MKLIIGLGNPGLRYAKTRHNAGYLAVDALASAERLRWSRKREWSADVADATLCGERVILVKPRTYMNLSGDAVRAVSTFYHVDPKDMLVVQDDMDIEEGRMQFKNGGSAAGHNGISDIQDKLGTRDFARLRIGIGRPPDRVPPDRWVLSRLSPTSAPPPLDIVAGMRDWIEYGTDHAANAWN